MIVGYVTLVVGTLVMCALASWMVKATQNGTLERNELVGIRTKATLASDEGWKAGHEAAIPALKAANITGLVGSVAAVIILIFLTPDDGEVTPMQYSFPAAIFAIQVFYFILGAVKGNNKAKEVNG